MFEKGRREDRERENEQIYAFEWLHPCHSDSCGLIGGLTFTLAVGLNDGLTLTQTHDE